MILALAGTQIVRSADKLAVVYLIDVSDSVGQQAQEAETAYVRDSLAAMQPDDQAAVIVFGGNALVERPMSSVRELAPLRSTPNSGNTDLEEAIGLGLALFPADAAKRMVILSDGQPTVGDADAAARRAAATGVQIDYVPVHPRRRARSPTERRARSQLRSARGSRSTSALTITAEAATPATVTIFAGGTIIQREQVDLRQGVNHYALTLQAGADGGFRDFRVQVDPVSADVFYQNNQLSAFNQVVGPPRVLVVSQTDDESRYLVQALTEQGLTVDVARPDGLPDRRRRRWSATTA